MGKNRFMTLNYKRHLARAGMLLIALHYLAHALSAELPSTQDVESRVVALTNDLRKAQKLDVLQSDPRLTAAARSFAAYVAKTDKLEHDADGSTPSDRAKKHDYDFCIVAENLANEYDSAGFTADRLARNFVQGWEQSPSHRENLLQPDVTQIGIGVAAGARAGEYYAVQMLARPRSQTLKFRVTNSTSSSVDYDFRKKRFSLAPKQTRNHESCVPGDITVEASGKQKPAAVRVKDGARYALIQAGGGYQIVQDK